MKTVIIAKGTMLESEKCVKAIMEISKIGNCMMVISDELTAHMVSDLTKNGEDKSQFVLIGAHIDVAAEVRINEFKIHVMRVNFA